MTHCHILLTLRINKYTTLLNVYLKVGYSIQYTERFHFAIFFSCFHLFVPSFNYNLTLQASSTVVTFAQPEIGVPHLMVMGCCNRPKARLDGLSQSVPTLPFTIWRCSGHSNNVLSMVFELDRQQSQMAIMFVLHILLAILCVFSIAYL